jgi:nucleoside-diphosphate-sugar epimerase
LTKVLVIGASGFLGSHVTRQLVEQGRDVRILVRPSSDTGTTDDLDIGALSAETFSMQRHSPKQYATAMWCITA